VTTRTKNLPTPPVANDFEYDSMSSDDLNAFALPGGKVFVNASSPRTKSEAELLGYSPMNYPTPCFPTGFNSRRGNLVANVTQFVPLGGSQISSRWTTAGYGTRTLWGHG